MQALLEQEIRDPRTVLYKLTVGEYHRMISRGILREGEPFELLDGNLVRKDRSSAGENPMTVGHQHALVVMKLNALNARLKKFGCHLRPQQPLTLEPNNEPEPDAAIVRGAIEDYADHHPGSQDVLCVIEVADSSLRRDRTTKLRIYAAAGIGQYVRINLAEKQVEIFSHPLPAKGKFQDSQVLSIRQSVEFSVGGGKSLRLPVRQLIG